jgi:hypothetical protein
VLVSGNAIYSSYNWIFIGHLALITRWVQKEGVLVKKGLLFLLCLAIILLARTAPAYADIGPKPSVVINFEGLEDQSYYVTLLSEVPSTGPYSVLGEHPNNQRYYEEDEDYGVWQKFVSYQDEDGFHFLQYFGNCTDTSRFTWGYHPPPRFKILLYFPEQNCFAASKEIYERYAFDSYYRVDATGLEMQPFTTARSISAEKDYDYTWETVSLLARIIATMAIEVLIALLIGFRAKKLLLVIGTTNIVTQTMLNILLNIFNYYQGSMAFVFHYIWMELLVIVIEAIIFSTLLPRYSGKEIMKRTTYLYAFSANAASFGVGLYLAQLIPGIF